MKIKTIKKLLNKMGIKYELRDIATDKWGWGFTTKRKVIVKLCELREVNHSWEDWEDDFSKDYGDLINKSFENLEYILQKEKKVILLKCDECCGCGDW